MAEYCVFEEGILYREGVLLEALIILQVFKTILFSLWESPSLNEDEHHVMKGNPDEEESQSLIMKSKRKSFQFMQKNYKEQMPTTPRLKYRLY